MIRQTVFVSLLLLSAGCSGSGGGEDDTESTQSTSTVCGDITVNACNNDSHDSQEASLEEPDSAPADESVDLGTDLQDGALRQAPAVAQKIAELEAQGQQVFSVWRLTAKDCEVNVGVCGGSVVNDNDSTTVNTTATSSGDGDASIEQN